LVGVVTPFNPGVAAALLLALVVGVACTRDPAALLGILIASVFLEIVTIGGVTLSRVVAPVALLIVLAAASRGRATFRAGAPLLWVGAYSVWAFASLLWTTDLSGTAYLLASLAIALVYMLSFASLVSSERVLRIVLYAFVVGSVAVGVLAVVSFLGLAASGTVELGRASGAVGDANFFAAYQLVVLPLALVLAAQARTSGTRVWLYAAIVVNVVSVLTTLSRGGLITLAALTLAALVLPSRAVFRSPGQKAVVMLVILVGAGVALKGLSGELLPRFTQIVSGQDSGGSGREVLWSGAATSVKERPLLGLGFGAYPASANELILRTPGVSLEHFALRPNGEQVHNLYLGTLTELGGVGLTLMLAMMASTFVWLRRTAARARAVGAELTARTASALTLSLVSWAVASLFLSSETSRPFWIIVGLSFALPKLVEAAEARAAEQGAS
jgi:O-antigen ligase